MLDLALAISNHQVISCWYKAGSAKLENYLCSQVLGVDWDDETVASSMKVITNLPLVRHQAGIIYSTQSSRIDAPRTRALFLLQHPIFDPDLHRSYARCLAGSLEGGKSETNPNRMFHGTGVAGEIVVLGNVMGNDVMEAINQDYLEWGAKPTIDYTGPLTAEVAEVRQLLRKIPPDCPYDEWFAACAAVHSVFPNEQGVALIEEWSPGYRGEVANKFKTFRPDRGITVRSLYHLARKYETKSRNFR